MANSAAQRSANIRRITGVGMLTAVAVVLQYIEIAIPIMPSFIKLDFSDLPELLGAFAYGPIAGLTIALLKNIIHLLVSQSGFIGELSNFILGGVLAFIAGAIYEKNKTKKTALIAGIVGAAAAAIVSLPSNYFIIYPLYYNVMGFPEAAILGMYQVLLPSVKNIFQCLLIFNVPFTLVKNLLCVVIAMAIYKPISPVLHGRKMTDRNAEVKD